jgi:hypothetical protein
MLRGVNQAHSSSLVTAAHISQHIIFMSVFRIHDIWIRIRGSMPLTIMDPDADPAIFLTDLQDANKKLILKSFSAYYFLNVHLHRFSRIKSLKEVTKQ